MKKIRVVSLFSGMGAYEKALKNLKIEYNLINYCEIDEIISNAYSILHNEPITKNLKDIKSINPKKIKNFDLLCYSPPCQSFSAAGKKSGLQDEKGNLFYDALKIIQTKKPKYCIMENVANLANKFKKEFNDMLLSLDNAGYNNYWKKINAKDFIPQNRDRVFVVSIRKDIDDGLFEFPLGSNQHLSWDTFIDISDTIELTDKQLQRVNYAKGINENLIKIKGVVQFKHSVISFFMNSMVFSDKREFPTLLTLAHQYVICCNERISRLHPRSHFKLMGFDINDYNKLDGKFSNKSLYKMTGNSICVPVLECIIGNLLKNKVIK